MLQKTEPGRRATLSKPPTMVRLWFNEKLEPTFSSATVSNSHGEKMNTESARVATDNPKLLELKLPSLPAGSYVVNYEVLSIDGHTVKSSYTFTVKGVALVQ